MASITRNARSSRLSLFDVRARDLTYRRGHGTSAFDDLNLSPDPAAAEARKVLDEWYSRIPPTKQDDLRGRFRKDDRQHSSALLELVTHELARRLFDRVVMDPSVDGKTPDFLASYHGTEFFVECTVAQGSDKEFGELRRERDVLDIVEQVNAGPYGLFLEPQQTGTANVPHKNLKGFLERELVALSKHTPIHDDLVGTLLSNVIVWKWEDWLLHFRPVVVGNGSGKQTVVGQHKGPYYVEDATVIRRSLEKKAEAYPHLERLYLIVATQREGTGSDDDLFAALLGDEIIELSPTFGMWETRRSFDGFFGSPSHPRNSHVSGVLHKLQLGSALEIPNKWHGLTTDWILVHHPAAKQPIPSGMFPIATEYVWESGKIKAIPATRTVNDVLGLPDPWPE